MKGKTEYTYWGVRLLLIALIILTGFLMAPAVHAQTTFTVNNGADADGSCSNPIQAADNLRRAICYANANAGTTLDLQPGATYTLSDGTQGSADDNNGGDLDIWASGLTINGNGAIIDMTLSDRVIEVLPFAFNLTINNVIIQGGNCAGTDWYGGGIENYGIGTVLNNVTIRNNTCGRGGGVANRASGTLTINNSTLSGNQATAAGGDLGGGGLINYGSNATVTIDSSTISNNTTSTASVNGGGLKNYQGTMTVRNSTISGNTAQYVGGGIHVNYGTVTLTNCTITGNQANLHTGGIRQYEGGTVSIKNTIISGNTAGNYDNINGTITSLGFNLIDNLDGAAFAASMGDWIGPSYDPMLGPLADNGGPTYTHALLTGSDAIDTGGCDYIIDQRGYPRTSPCDIGAFELAGITLTISDVNETGTTIATVTRTSTSGAVTLNLTSNDPTEATVPLTVTIPDGSTTATFTVTGVDDGIVDGTQAVTITAQGGIYSTSTDIDVIDGNKATFFSPGSLTIREGDPTVIVELCLNPTSASNVTFALSFAPLGEITLNPANVTINSGVSCFPFIAVTAVDDVLEEPNVDITVTATEVMSSEGYPDATMTVTVQDDDTPYLLLNAPASITEGDSAVDVTVTRSKTTGAATIRLTTADRTTLSLTGGTDGAGTTQYRDIVLADGVATATFQINGVQDVDMDIELVTLTAGGTYATGTFEDLQVDVMVLDDDVSFGPVEGLSSQTFPTALFIASYDWLTGFYDYNNQGRGSTDSAGHNIDPDTDNFNKILLKDSNLFPLITATLNDLEFPNITGRNTDKLNDYINRSVAVVPNYINTTTAISYANSNIADIKAVGMRSHLSWVFVTDPANHNLRRYQFEPHDGFYYKLDNDDEDRMEGDYRDADQYCDTGEVSIGENDCLAGHNVGNCIPNPMNYYYVGDVTYLLDNNQNERDVRDVYLANSIERVMFFCRDSAFNYPIEGDATENKFYTAVGGQNDLPITNYRVKIEEARIARINNDGYIPITYMGNSSDASGVGVWLAINGQCTVDPCGTTGNHDNRSDWTTTTGTSYKVWQLGPEIALSDDTQVEMTKEFNYQLPPGGITSAWDLDGDPNNGVIELRVGFTASKQGGLVLGYAAIGREDRQDRGFGVALPGDELYYEYSEDEKEARWNNIDTFLETVPPESYPGYDTFTSGFGEKIAYGYPTNTSFDTADNVRFKNPRDVDAFRDYFDIENEGPAYIFVADTMNSRIQVFMNATGSAGNTGAPFPIRPVRVKGPNDVGDYAYLAYTSNELAMRPKINEAAGGLAHAAAYKMYGDGRKSDWRPFLPNYTSGGMTFMNVSTGKGEFFYPHGVAVDQDPDTQDVYLFVADTFNHRIQVFRSATSLANQPISGKRFNFEFEAGWGAYPLQTTIGTPPGPYGYKYPKGIDVARFANNSSYLYVVDSKNYRLMKYLITESGSGGFQSISAVAGYGHDGTSYSKNLVNNAGVALTSQTSTTAGFLNPQDVATGYNGFFRYTSLGGGGWKFLNNHMVYITDYARDDNLDHGTATNWQNRLNMRVMQFIDGFPNTTALDGVYLPWGTESVAFGNFSNLQLEQSIFGSSSGRYNSQGVSTSSYTARPGPPENAGVNNVFTERPVGIATLAWNTTEPIDMRVVHSTNDIVYANGATIPLNTDLMVGTASGKFFAFPESSRATYTDYTGLTVDGRRVRKVHIFWYNNDGSYRAHQSVTNRPYVFNTGATAGYMKVIAEDIDFMYSGRSGTQIFRIK